MSPLPFDGKASPDAPWQCAALPYRRGTDGELSLCLITSRGSGQWIIPKGKPIEGLTASETAAREAFEEAGLIGVMESEPVGQFSYIKDQGRRGEQFVPTVEVYLMEVTQQLTLWPEMGQRQMLWFDLDTAISVIEIPQLKDIVRRAFER
ncbi:MAG: NUDIX hydrolase [Asticcacaulis sp.]